MVLGLFGRERRVPVMHSSGMMLVNGNANGFPHLLRHRTLLSDLIGMTRCGLEPGQCLVRGRSVLRDELNRRGAEVASGATPPPAARAAGISGKRGGAP